jgi:phosphoribosylglycinamide formyltransferase-1
MAPVPRLGVLISGRGSNLGAILDAIGDGRLAARVAVVVSNVAEAAGLDRARAGGVDTVVISHRSFEQRRGFDLALADELCSRNVDLVCLAGFMRLLGPAFIQTFPHRILNVHPSLLPAFPGVDAQRQAIDYGVKVSGATVHLVNADLDAGPIVLQAAVPVIDGDTVETLSARILAEEHRLYPLAIERVLNGGWTIEGRRFICTPKGNPS